LDQHVLHHRTIHLRWCTSRTCLSTGSMGLWHPLCHPVVLALVLDPSHLFCTRIPVSPSSKGQTR
jgi:hypothetical protein